MGLDIQNAKFLSLGRALGVDYSSTLTFGRQHIVIDDRSKIAPKEPNSSSQSLISDKYADSFLKFLGAARVDACDVSSYEGANIIFDLNEPPPDTINSAYSCVIDLGTLEHVFNYSTALKTAMSSVAENGHIIIATPANNLMGHGFYQLSPELFLRAFNDDNGFRVIKMVLADQFEESPWYEVNLEHKPADLKTRFVAPSAWAPTYLMIIAKREAIKPIFARAPNQMSYESLWARQDTGTELTTDNKKSMIAFKDRMAMLVRRSRFISLYRQLRAIFKSVDLSDYYKEISSNEWMKY